jgi:hypothetical protein
VLILLGAEYQAVVEYAPVEKTPFKTKSKVDQRVGTIEDGTLSSAAVDLSKLTTQTQTTSHSSRAWP